MTEVMLSSPEASISARAAASTTLPAEVRVMSPCLAVRPRERLRLPTVVVRPMPPSALTTPR